MYRPSDAVFGRDILSTCYPRLESSRLGLGDRDRSVARGSGPQVMLVVIWFGHLVDTLFEVFSIKFAIVSW